MHGPDIPVRPMPALQCTVSGDDGWPVSLAFWLAMRCTDSTLCRKLRKFLGESGTPGIAAIIGVRS